jgi:hypothetical protein
VVEDHLDEVVAAEAEDHLVGVEVAAAEVSLFEIVDSPMLDDIYAREIS